MEKPTKVHAKAPVLGLGFCARQAAELNAHRGTETKAPRGVPDNVFGDLVNAAAVFPWEIAIPVSQVALDVVMNRRGLGFGARQLGLVLHSLLQAGAQLTDELLATR